MRVNNTTKFPTECLSEKWAQKVHGQSLARLDERGGMSPQEIFVNLNKLDLRLDQWAKLDEHECLEFLLNYITMINT